jgi:hypothetical protein
MPGRADAAGMGHERFDQHKPGANGTAQPQSAVVGAGMVLPTDGHDEPALIEQPDCGLPDDDRHGEG